jgi:hypothetical protein
MTGELRATPPSAHARPSPRDGCTHPTNSRISQELPAPRCNTGTACSLGLSSVALLLPACWLPDQHPIAGSSGRKNCLRPTESRARRRRIRAERAGGGDPRTRPKAACGASRPRARI